MFCLSPCFCICAFYDILPLTQALDTSSPGRMTWLETLILPPRLDFSRQRAELGGRRGQYSGLEPWAPSLIRLEPAWTPAIHQCSRPGGHRAENINFPAKPCVCFFLICTNHCVSPRPTSGTASSDFASCMSHNLASGVVKLIGKSQACNLRIYICLRKWSVKFPLCDSIQYKFLALWFWNILLAHNLLGQKPSLGHSWMQYWHDWNFEPLLSQVLGEATSLTVTPKIFGSYY